MLTGFEFETRTKDGLIQIPEEYKKDFGDGTEVKVIILKSAKKISKTGMFAEMMRNPVKVEGLRSMKRDEIYDR
ncbi:MULTISPECIES: hypothetical protein [Floridanema]|uniref:SpoVT-AbrB domain-containing protein n=2 Tax=Floridanema TaxID=3396149 RepID=A0ABV4XQ99_9CYAN